MRARIARRREQLRAGDSYRLPQEERIVVWREANGVTTAGVPYYRWTGDLGHTPASYERR